ncbi:MAG: tRNA-binding protein [Gemmatimonadota bacterium]|nr:MAG: tRNA-binding protein [Gemmatimonadota bacterium]
MATLDQFLDLDTRISAVVTARRHSDARKHAFQLQIDFGAIGIKQSSAQVTKRYQCSDLLSRHLEAVANFPDRRVAGYRSDVRVLGGALLRNDVALLNPDANVPDGARIG